MLYLDKLNRPHSGMGWPRISRSWLKGKSQWPSQKELESMNSEGNLGEKHMLELVPNYQSSHIVPTKNMGRPWPHWVCQRRHEENDVSLDFVLPVALTTSLHLSRIYIFYLNGLSTFYLFLQLWNQMKLQFSSVLRTHNFHPNKNGKADMWREIAQCEGLRLE